MSTGTPIQPDPWSQSEIDEVFERLRNAEAASQNAESGTRRIERKLDEIIRLLKRS